MKLSDILELETRLPISLIEIDDKLLQDIERNGIKEPIEIRVRPDGSWIVWDGLHRLAIAKKLGIEDVPVMLMRM